MAALLRGRSILIAEDESLVGFALARTIEEEGGTVVGPAGSVGAALGLLDEARIDAGVVDAMLADGYAIGLAAELEARRIPYIVVSAYDPTHLPPILRGAPFVAKPYSSSALVEAMTALGSGQ